MSDIYRPFNIRHIVNITYPSGSVNIYHISNIDVHYYAVVVDYYLVKGCFSTVKIAYSHLTNCDLTDEGYLAACFRGIITSERVNNILKFLASYDGQ